MQTKYNNKTVEGARKALTTLSLLTVAQLGFALGEGDTIQSREVLNKEVQVVKAYTPSISDAYKIENQPTFDDKTKRQPKFDYKILDIPMSTDSEASSIEPALFESQDVDRTMFGSIKGGFGNYTSPLFDFFFNKKADEKNIFGLHYYHRSANGKVKLESGEKTNAPWSKNKFEAFTLQNLKNAQLSININYDRDVTAFYGSIDSIKTVSNIEGQEYGKKQKLARIGGSVGLKSLQDSKSPLKYNARVKYANLSTSFDQSENQAGLYSDWGYTFGNINTVMDFDVEYTSVKDVAYLVSQEELEKRNNVFLDLAPGVIFEGNTWKLRSTLEFNMLTFNGMDTELYVFPHIEGNFAAVPGLMNLFVELEGGITPNYYSDILSVNPYLQPEYTLLPTKEKYNFTFGLNGTVAKTIDFGASINLTGKENAHFFVQNIVIVPEELSMMGEKNYTNRFTPNYNDLTSLSLVGNLKWTSKRNDYIEAKVTYSSYSVDEVNEQTVAPAEAWLLPTFELELDAKYQFTDQLAFRAHVLSQNKREGFTQTTYTATDGNLGRIDSQVVELDGFTDVSIGAEYEFMKNLRAFADVNNLLSKRYQLYQGYTVQGFQFIAGAIYVF